MDQHTGYIVREGVPFIVGLGILTVALFWMGFKAAAVVAVYVVLALLTALARLWNVEML